VLYPADDHMEGKTLRIRQQYFFVSATAQSIVREHRARYGTVKNFAMNDKCAAGTGRFFEVLTHRLLGIEMEDLSDLIIRSEHPIEISSMCTIFAESEIISYVSGGTAMEDIAAGTGYAIARRIVAQGQAARIPMKEQIIFSGGVAHNEGIRRIFEDLTGHKIIAAKDPQCTAALGAAVTALKAYEKK
jgi:predicted CoA-substrate-specific enzyme activase